MWPSTYHTDINYVKSVTTYPLFIISPTFNMISIQSGLSKSTCGISEAQFSFALQYNQALIWTMWDCHFRSRPEGIKKKTRKEDQPAGVWQDMLLAGPSRNPLSCSGAVVPHSLGTLSVTRQYPRQNGRIFKRRIPACLLQPGLWWCSSCLVRDGPNLGLCHLSRSLQSWE